MIEIITLSIAFFAGICVAAVLFIALGYIFVKKYGDIADKITKK